MFKEGRKLKLSTRQYDIGKEVGRGGSGVVYRAEASGRPYAIKVFFPFYQLQLFNDTAQATSSIRESLHFQRREFEFLSELSHPNIVRVHEAGEVNLTIAERKSIPLRDVTALPVVVMDYVDGTSLRKAIASGLSATEVTFVLIRLARALEYLHAERFYMHVDVKSENVLVRTADHEPVLIDFALCKNLNFNEVRADEPTKLLGDWDLFPKDIGTEHRLKEIKATQGLRQELFDLAFPTLDLFQFGKLLRSLMPELATLYDVRDVGYLAELADQLTDWKSARKWGPRDLAPRLDRLGIEHFAAFGVPELIEPSTAERTVVLPAAAGVPVTKHIQRVIETRSFRRLTQINQLSLVSFIYPGADYKRSVHVLHSYDVARQFTIHLFSSPLFRMHFDRRRVQQLLTTVLLHDINHFPFLHILQESVVPALKDIDLIDLFCNGEATGELEAGDPSLYSLLAEIGISPTRFKRLIMEDHHQQEGPDTETDQIISSLLNSGVDVDKLSYLTLDAHFTGVSYGRGIDLPTLLKAAGVGRLIVGGRETLHVAFDDRGLQAVENVVLTRFWNFRAIYWHHTNRALMAMLLHVFRRLYVDQGRNVLDYLLETMWHTDMDVVRYLDTKWFAQTKQRSVLNGLAEDRSRLYRRIYTVRAGAHDTLEDDIYNKLKELDYTAEVRIRRHLAEAIRSLIPTPSDGGKISEEDVLLDIPRRQMDSGGPVYLSAHGGSLVALSQLSDPIRMITANYERLTKRARIFLAPRLAKTLDGRWRVDNRAKVQQIIREALDASRMQSQVQ